MLFAARNPIKHKSATAKCYPILDKKHIFSNMSNKVEQFNEKLDHVKRFLQETERINPSEEARERFLKNLCFHGKK